MLSKHMQFRERLCLHSMLVPVMCHLSCAGSRSDVTSEERGKINDIFESGLAVLEGPGAEDLAGTDLLTDPEGDDACEMVEKTQKVCICLWSSSSSLSLSWCLCLCQLRKIRCLSVFASRRGSQDVSVFASGSDT